MASLLSFPSLISSHCLLHPHIISSHLFSLLLRRPPLIPRFLLILPTSHLPFPSRLATLPFSILETPQRSPSFFPIPFPFPFSHFGPNLSTSISCCSSFPSSRCSCLRSHCHSISRQASLSVPLPLLLLLLLYCLFTFLMNSSKLVCSQPSVLAFVVPPLLFLHSFATSLSPPRLALEPLLFSNRTVHLIPPLILT